MQWVLYTVSQKGATKLKAVTSTDFQNYFTASKRSKFPIKLVYYLHYFYLYYYYIS